MRISKFFLKCWIFTLVVEVLNVTVCFRVLLRMRMLYYIKQEIIAGFSQKIDDNVSASELPICPPGLIVDTGPVEWWDREADGSLLIGTYKHGYERYNIMRQDSALCFLTRCGPPDGSAVLAEISPEV